MKHTPLEDEEVIATIGGESEEKAKSAVREALKLTEIEENKKRDEKLNQLDDLRNQVKSYTQALLVDLHSAVERLPVPKGWQWGTWFDGKGIRLVLISPAKKRYERAFKLSNDPQLDFNAIKEFQVWAEDKIDLEQPPTQSGLWVPS